MSKRLVLAEKPSVGKEIARVLQCKSGGNGYYEGKDTIVTWALGHLVTLADPEVYDDKYKNWVLEDLPIIPDSLKLVTIKNTAKQFHTVKKLMQRGDVKEIIIATDAGREGELVARWIIDKIRINKPIKRLWISSVTDKAIKDGFRNLKPGKHYEALYKAAVARAEGDWLVGINGTRALTTKYNAQLSMGRVQTPTLALIQGREEEIRTFRPKDFFGITINAMNVDFMWKNTDNDTRSFDEAYVSKIIKDIESKKAKAVEVEKKLKKKFPDKLYDLTQLQRDAHKRYGYSPKETLSLMQRLYEQHKVLTYPRTDSNYLTSDMVDTLKDRLKAIRIDPYRSFAFSLLKTPIRAGKHFVDDKKVTDHHAIIPTEEAANTTDMSYEERRIYELVVQRFLEVLMPPYEYEETKVVLKIEQHTFEAKGHIAKELGFMKLRDRKSTDVNMPSFREKQEVSVTNIKKTKGATKAPDYFNEASLLSAMENPAKYLNESEKNLKKILTETGGLGTVATRADIMEKLLNTKLMEKKGQLLRITRKGKQLLDIAPVDLTSPVLTAKWESKLDAIAKGKLNSKEFSSEVKDYAIQVVEEIKGSKKSYKHDNLTSNKCPKCGKAMMAVDNKHGKSLACQDRSCGYRESISKVTNARCPECRKKLNLIGPKDKKIFACKCGFKESMASFEKRKKERDKQGGKRDFIEYKKKQEALNKKTSVEDNPFANALKGLKFD
ncbi:MAG: DNA topoisomerase III [Alkaliphilus sp.]